ncbi:MFS transporter [Archangium violaceum]|uniref:MFS transporter n=1 Tax=Archangium violaceum TaxID=83451 RepID=UPI0019502417|nr:MFS transporter [Archangium violaceum]QRN98762.1 MFS transporter [Archangium violaceum]
MNPRPLLLAIAYLAFISLGLPDAVLGVAWPSVRETFSLPLSGLGMVLVGTGTGYFLSGLVAGRLVQALGVGTLLTVSSALVALSLFGYSLAPMWPLFLLCTPFIGLGSGAIDSGINAYAASHFPVRHVNWLHACYGFGAMLGPLVMTAMLVRSGSWRWGYAIIGAMLLLMALTFGATRASWKTEGTPGADGSDAPTSASQALRHPMVWLQIVIFFVYTGLEVTAGQWCFTLYTQARAVPAELAGTWTGLYWGSLAVGRVFMGFVVERLGPDRLLRFSILSAVAGSALFAFGPTLASLGGLLLIGMSLAPIYPTLMSRTPGRLGAGYAAHAVGFQVSAAMLGAAALPSLAGVLAARFGLGLVGWVTVVAAALLCLLHETLLKLTPRSAA